MPDTTPLPLPECPRGGGCTHRGNLKMKFDGGRNAVLCEDCRTVLGYAPRTQPAPLDAILAAAEDAKRAHDRLCDLGETLLPESSQVKTADNPAPVVLPTVDEAAEAVVQSTRDEGWSYRTTAQAVLDLIAARMPVWVPVEPGTVIKAGTLYRVEWDPKADDEPTTAAERVAYSDCIVDPTDPGRYSIDPRTVPAEPEDPRVAVVAHALSDILDDNGVTTCDWTAEAHDILARLDAVRAES